DLVDLVLRVFVCHDFLLCPELPQARGRRTSELSGHASAVRGVRCLTSALVNGNASYCRTGNEAEHWRTMEPTWRCPVTCPKCKSEQPDNAKFCSQCAAPLTDPGQKLAVKSKIP